MPKRVAKRKPPGEPKQTKQVVRSKTPARARRKPAARRDSTPPAADEPAKPDEPPKGDDLAYIAESLRPLAVPIDDLQPDPVNARTHDERNLAAIRASLARFGQRTPLVVNRNRAIVLKGNGTMAAARGLGWTHLAVVWVDDDPATATGFALADNRTAELSGWDDKLLASHLKALDDLEGFDLADTGFDQEELATLIESSLTDPPKGNAPQGHKPPKADEPPKGAQFHLLVLCDGPEDQNKLCSQLQEEGIKCRPFDV